MFLIGLILVSGWWLATFVMELFLRNRLCLVSSERVVESCVYCKYELNNLELIVTLTAFNSSCCLSFSLQRVSELDATVSFPSTRQRWMLGRLRGIWCDLILRVSRGGSALIEPAPLHFISTGGITGPRRETTRSCCIANTPAAASHTNKQQSPCRVVCACWIYIHTRWHSCQTSLLCRM